MKCCSPGAVRFPRMYQAFKSVEEVSKVINRSKSYVHKALKEGFTDREWEMLARYSKRQDLKAERQST